ncbi:hypothetical protein [Rhodococcus spongiicola]|uniref:HTH cro/C1-type domain-containing protein n=1 Tax=Rhodococcus spongiicola TaxID=2487352 RepID=A0A438AQH5_9NOCA|nr:hypothetical protein [Rhodococcus spongiicola]RVW00872.1 hypothetical protein EF834_15895 [Rhodococcus spongiicola]
MTSWANEAARRIGKAIKDARGDERTAQWLADRTRDLGHPISRTAFSEYETGKRKTMPVTDLVVIARALNVPPIQLLYPALPDGQVEAWPGHETRSILAARWFSGEIRANETSDYLTGNSPSEDEAQAANSELIQRSRQLEEYRSRLVGWATSNAGYELEQARRSRDEAAVQLAEGMLERAKAADRDMREYVVQLMAAMISRGMKVEPQEGYDSIYWEASERARAARQGGDA